MSAAPSPVVREDHPPTVEAMLTRYAALIDTLARRQWRRARSHTEFQDMRSIAQVAAWKAFKGFDPERGATFPTWLTWKVGGALQDEVRRLTNMRSRVGGFTDTRVHTVPLESCAYRVVDTAPGPHDLLEREELRMMLDRRLQPDEAAVLRGIYVDGLTGPEAAVRIRRSPTRAAQLKITGLAKLREWCTRQASR